MVAHNVNPLQATGQLPPVEWLNAPATRIVTQALTAHGAEIRFVGGCVRDALGHRQVKDIDLATPDPPDQVMALLRQAGIRVLPTGLKHGTVTAIVDHQHFEITTLRIDLETDGRRAEVAFTDDWLEDAKRRDFTFNALSANLAGEVFDPFSGLWDLAHGQVRFIGSAHDRVAEDYLRILRYFRFYGSHGRPPIDSEAIAACRAFANKLTEISGERVQSEFMKILCVADPAEILIKMKGAEVLHVILPEAGDPGVLRLVNWLETRAVIIAGVSPDPIRHLGALICETTTNVQELARRLKLSNRDQNRLQLICDPPVAVTADMGELAETKALRAYGIEQFIDFALIQWARELYAQTHLPPNRKKIWVELLERAVRWSTPTFPLTGQDVMALGIEPGPKIGNLLAAVETWWENHSYTPSRQECLNRLFDEANRL